MKKFTISILCVAVFFIGLGGLIQETGARFKSDERSLELIRQAQTAIGGETAVRNVRSLSINGRVTKTFDFDGTTRVEQGESEINLQFPNQFAKMMKLGRDDNATEGKTAELRKEVRVVVTNGEGETPLRTRIDAKGEKGNVVIVRRGAGEKVLSGDKIADDNARKTITNENIDVIRSGGVHQQNEMFRTTLALFLNAAPETEFTYAGEGDVDGGNCDIVEARNGGSTVKLFLDKSSHLPRMISYQGHKAMVFRIRKDDAKTDSDMRVFERGSNKPETAEFQIRFSDYRAVNGILLPHRWTQTVGGSADEIFDVTGYEINPANIAEKFQNLPPRVLIRTGEKPQ